MEGGVFGWEVGGTKLGVWGEFGVWGGFGIWGATGV